jgi:hypothetical protein
MPRNATWKNFGVLAVPSGASIQPPGLMCHILKDLHACGFDFHSGL